MANTKINIERINGQIKTQDADFVIAVNDGGVNRNAFVVNGAEGAITLPRQSNVEYYTTVAQVIANITQTLVNSTNVEVMDVLAECSDGVTTIKVPGVYLVQGSVIWANVNSGSYYQMTIWANGSQVWASYATAPGNLSHFPLHIFYKVYLSAGTTIDMRVYQASGGNESLVQYENILSITKVA